MIARFDVRRRDLRVQLHERRVADRDVSAERLMADAFILDEILTNEFGSLPRESVWCYNTGGGKKAAATQAKRFKSAGVYDDIGGVQ